MSDTPKGTKASAGESISLRFLFGEFWAARRTIVLILGGVALMFGIFASVAFLTRASERTASVSFRLRFEGADRGEYPNGSRFSRSDIIATSVLTQVYDRNELERYLPFDVFKSGLFIFERSFELDMLNMEYSAKLSDTRLPAPQRSVIEAEFRQKMEALRIPQLSLQFMLSGQSASPPDHVMEKVLNDILAVWAESAAVQKGALGYQVELITPNVILKDTLNTQTMLIRYDILRRHVSRVMAQVDRLSELPGASTIRVGQDRLSLLDLRTNLQDLLEFQLNPIIRRRLVLALPPGEAALNILYLEDRILELQRILGTSSSRKTQLQAALQTFAPDAAGNSAPGLSGAEAGGMQIAPQLSDGFLDRLMDLAGRSGALDYRKELTDRIIQAGEDGLDVEVGIAFYQETLRLLRAAMAGNRPTAIKPEDIVKAFEQLQTRVVEILNHTNEAYATISSVNLNPRSVLYQLVSPYSVRTLRTVNVRSLAILGAVVMVVTILVIFAFIGGRAALRHYKVV